jgi:hypothetical protein
VSKRQITTVPKQVSSWLLSPCGFQFKSPQPIQCPDRKKFSMIDVTYHSFTLRVALG